MPDREAGRNIVIVNQAANYLTIGICNAFNKKFDQVNLISGSIHVQGEDLDASVKVKKINKWAERPQRKKLFSYIIACWKIYWLLLFKYRSNDVFFVSLPPMAYLLSIGLPNRCSMLIWDVYPDIFKITEMNQKHPIYRVWALLNRIAFKKAYRLFTVGKQMAALIEKYVDRRKIQITPLWSIFQENNKVEKKKNLFIKEHGLEGKFIVQYSGNIGLTHNVEVMVELADLMREHEDILFQIIGRGPKMPHLKNLVEKKDLPNCKFFPFQSDEMFPYSLSAADIGVVILDEAASKGSVPSKSYNLMSYGIPTLYIASEDSELNHYAQKYNHAECYEHNAIDDAVNYIKKLYNNRNLQQRYAKNAEKASKYYKRNNADKLADKYIETKISY